MSKFLGVWGGGPPGHYLDATPVEVKSGQNLVFPLKKGRVSLCGKRGLDLHRGRKFVSVRGGPHPTPPFFAPNPLSLWGFVVSFWRLVLFGAGHVVQVDL